MCKVTSYRKSYILPTCVGLTNYTSRDLSKEWIGLFDKKKRDNTHGKILLLVKLQANACNSIKSNTPL